MKKALLLVFGFAVILNVSFIQAQNLLTNPGFETWTTGTTVQPIGWTITNAVNASQNTTSFTEGTKSCRVAASNANFALSQIPTVVAGKTYSLSVSYNIEAVSGTGKDARIWCYFRNAAGVALPLSLDDSLGLKGPGGLNGYFTTVTGSWKTYTYMFVAPSNAVSFYFSAITSKGATVSWDNFSLAVNTTPTITCSKTTLTGFTYVPGAGPSSEQSFSVKGNNLTSSIIITAPANYEISGLSGASFRGTNSITYTNSGGSTASIQIYVRLIAGLTANTYNGNVTLTASGATTQNIALSGTVAMPPVVINSSVTTLPTFTYIEGSGPSTQQTFTVSGTGLTAGITITAPANYEISLVSGLFNGATSFTIPQSGGSIAATPIYIRLITGLTPARYSGNVTLASSGGISKTVVLTGTVTSAPGLNVSQISLTGFSYNVGAGPSSEQSFTVSGINLTSFIILTPPAGYEISESTGSSFTGTNYLILPQAGTLTPIYVRLKTGLAVSNYSGSISITSGAFSKTIALNGNVLLGTAVENTNSNGFKAYGSGNEIIVEGTTANEMITIYNLVGIQLKSVRSIGDRIAVPASKGSVYLVRTSTKTVKVIM
jgi:hypothetical protein